MPPPLTKISAGNHLGFLNSATKLQRMLNENFYNVFGHREIVAYGYIRKPCNMTMNRGAPVLPLIINVECLTNLLTVTKPLLRFYHI